MMVVWTGHVCMDRHLLDSQPRPQRGLSHHGAPAWCRIRAAFALPGAWRSVPLSLPASLMAGCTAEPNGLAGRTAFGTNAFATAGASPAARKGQQTVRKGGPHGRDTNPARAAPRLGRNHIETTLNGQIPHALTLQHRQKLSTLSSIWSCPPCITCTIRAQIITNTILGVPCYNYSIMGQKNPILIVKAPILERFTAMIP